MSRVNKFDTYLFGMLLLAMLAALCVVGALAVAAVVSGIQPADTTPAFDIESETIIP